MQNRGFSLLELSIVLVIIGLIAGGIVAGSSMIRAAELRAVITEFDQYKTAVHTFRDKYLGLPGDLKNATAFWGAAHATPATCLTTVGTGTQTCDGNGDGKITDPAAGNQYGERFTFWQHLANAELIAGTYSGIAGSSGIGHTLDTNVPTSKLSGGGWLAFNWDSAQTGQTSVFDGDYTKNNLHLQGFSTGAFAPLLSPEEVWNIDTKIDDGRPAYGMMQERNWGPCTTATASSQRDVDYALTSTGIDCVPLFIDVF